ncbi:MAG TPA: hypothetical protein VII33_00225 [Nakamurella sp.]
MWQIIRDLAGNGVTIFLTTQYLEEADQLAHRIAVLDQGRLVAQGSAIELKRRIPGGHIRLRFTVAGAAQGTAISIATDVHAGIIARFRTMAIARSAVLTGRAWRPRAASQCSISAFPGQRIRPHRLDVAVGVLESIRDPVDSGR